MPDKKPKVGVYNFSSVPECICTPVEIFTGEYNAGKKCFVDALWDTGACISIITPDTVQRLGLTKISTMLITGVTGSGEVDVVLASLKFPHGTIIENFDVAVCPLGHICGMLIGMDIISQTDFAISSGGGKTTFSFAMPPFEDKFDFGIWEKTLKGK